MAMNFLDLFRACPVSIAFGSKQVFDKFNQMIMSRNVWRGKKEALICIFTAWYEWVMSLEISCISLRNLQPSQKVCSKTRSVAMTLTRRIIILFVLCLTTLNEWQRNIRKHQGVWS